MDIIVTEVWLPECLEWDECSLGGKLSIDPRFHHILQDERRKKDFHAMPDEVTGDEQTARSPQD